MVVINRVQTTSFPRQSVTCRQSTCRKRLWQGYLILLSLALTWAQRDNRILWEGQGLRKGELCCQSQAARVDVPPPVCFLMCEMRIM